MRFPFAILLWIFDNDSQGEDVERAIANLCLLALFSLLHPREYLAGSKDTLSAPFRFLDIFFFINEQRFCTHQ